VFVSILTVFSESSEIDTPVAILNFFLFFVLLWQTWLSQFVYDAKFQSDDWYHRFFKLCQIAVFLQMGGSSAGWAPTHLRVTPDDFSEQATINCAQLYVRQMSRY
jgi:hypothetical protein